MEAGEIHNKKNIKRDKKKTEKISKKSAVGNIFTILGLVIWAGFSCIAAQFIVGLPLLWILGKTTFGTPVWTTIYTALTYLVAAAMVIFIPKFVKKELKTNRAELGLSGLPTFTDIGISILGIIATFLIAGVVTTLLSNFAWFDAGEAQDIGYSTQVIGFDRVVAFLALVVFAPLFEELIFRGWLYGKLKNYTSVGVTMAVVSVLFGALHGQLNVGVTVGIMSLVMCFEREMTGTIYAGILTHMLKNGLAFYLLFIV